MTPTQHRTFWRQWIGAYTPVKAAGTQLGRDGWPSTASSTDRRQMSAAISQTRQLRTRFEQAMRERDSRAARMLVDEMRRVGRRVSDIGRRMSTSWWSEAMRGAEAWARNARSQYDQAARNAGQLTSTLTIAPLLLLAGAAAALYAGSKRA